MALLNLAASSPVEQLDALCEQAEVAIQASPDNTFCSLMAQGLAHWRAKRHLQALASLDRVAKPHQQNSDYLVLRGMVLRQFPERHDEAIQAFRQAIAETPDRADSYYNLANLLTDQDREHQAERAYRLSLQFNPKAPLALHNLGMCLNGQQRFSRGLGGASKQRARRPFLSRCLVQSGSLPFRPRSI